MARKRRLSQTQSARTLRRATAYYRLAVKADKAGDGSTWLRMTDKANTLRDKAYRQREAEERVAAARAQGMTPKP